MVRSIIAGGRDLPATDLFRAQYRLADLQRQCAAQIGEFDCLLTPTAGRLFTVAEMLAQPVLHNSQLGFYTNFMNLLDMAAVAVPTTFTARGLPFGVTLAGPAFSDRALLSIANRLRALLPLPLGALDIPSVSASGPAWSEAARTDIVVCGAHLEGLPLNWQLVERGAVFRERTASAASYRLYLLAGGPPMRPGMVRDEERGQAIEVEIWSIPTADLGSFVAAIPAPLGIGKVELADGRWLSGFICEPQGVLTAAGEITRHGGWRAWLDRDAAD
ncbi:MAG: amidase family protein [Haliea sp.]